MSKKVLSIGFDPKVLDFTSPELVAANLTAEKVAAGINGQIAQLRAEGFDATKLWVDLGETAEEVIREHLAAVDYDCILIGAGIRNNPKTFLTFERIVNAVHQGAPRARICFNTQPTDTVDAVRRWI